MGEITNDRPEGARRMPLMLLVQGVMLWALMCFVTLAPPAEGTMLLVPTAQSTGQTLDSALHSGAKLVGRGPLPDSIVVEGRRDALLSTMISAGTLVIASSRVPCGTIA